MPIPTLSIIIAVYNAEKTISRCIDSILKQSYTNFEILLVNDGSKDSSADICNQYALKDKRVRVFHKKNGGVSSARNLGLHNIKGDWFTFIDSDDEITQNALNIEWNSISEDLIILPFITVDLCGKKEYIDYTYTHNSTEKFLFFKNDINNNSIKFICSKIYRHQILNDLRFDTKMKFSEDLLFNLAYLSNCSKIRIITHPFYIYYKDDSIFWNKYEHSITESIYSLKTFHIVYSQSGLDCPELEKDVFFNFKRLCQKEINKNPWLWYKNKTIKIIYNSIKRNIGWKQKIHYSIMSIPIFLFLNLKLSKYKKRT